MCVCLSARAFHIFLRISSGVRYDVLTDETTKCTISWDLTPCSPEEVHRNFEGKYCLYLQGRNISRRRNQTKAGGKQGAAHCYLFPSGFFFGLLFDSVNRDTALLRNLNGLLTDSAALRLREPVISLNSISLLVFGTETPYIFYTYE